MKKWLVTFVAMDVRSRRRVGKSKVDVVETEQMGPAEVEAHYEAMHRHPLQRDFRKVIDVREAQ